MDITLSMTTENAKKAVDALCAHYNYQAAIPNPENGDPVPNPETRAAFAKRCIKNFIVEHVQAYALEEARRIAEENATTAFDVQ